jgi:hypothetical protein
MFVLPFRGCYLPVTRSPSLPLSAVFGAYVITRGAISSRVGADTP